MMSFMSLKGVFQCYLHSLLGKAFLVRGEAHMLNRPVTGVKGYLFMSVFHQGPTDGFQLDGFFFFFFLEIGNITVEMLPLPPTTSFLHLCLCLHFIHSAGQTKQKTSRYKEYVLLKWHFWVWTLNFKFYIRLQGWPDLTGPKFKTSLALSLWRYRENCTFLSKRKSKLTLFYLNKGSSFLYSSWKLFKYESCRFYFGNSS